MACSVSKQTKFGIKWYLDLHSSEMTGSKMSDQWIDCHFEFKMAAKRKIWVHYHGLLTFHANEIW